MAGKRNQLIGGGVGGLLTGAWGFYSNLTTIKDLPENAGWIAKMLVDPPVYAPWLLFAACVLFFARVFWERDEEPSDVGSSTTIRQRTNGGNSPAIGSVGGDANFNFGVGETPPAKRRKNVGEWPIVEAIVAIQNEIGPERDAWLEFRQAAHDDKIGVWGRPEKTRSKWGELQKEIPSAYWDDWKLVRDLDALRKSDVAHTEQESSPRTYLSFTNLKVDQYEIERWLGRGPDFIIFDDGHRGPHDWMK